jgi:menaquinone-specific isochorismate synthase
MVNIGSVTGTDRDGLSVPIFSGKDLSKLHRRFIRACLAEKITATFTPTNEASGRLLSFSCALDSFCIMDWLMAQDNPVKLYWSSRGGCLEIAGVGLADIINSPQTSCLEQALGEIETNLANASADIRYYGGMCFDLTDSATAWEGLGHYSFFVPQFELRQENDQTHFSFNIMTTPQDDVDSMTKQFLQSFDRLSFKTPETLTNPSCLPSVLRRSDMPNQSSWQQQTRELVEHIRANRVKKIVQTRVTSLELATAPDPLLLLNCARNQSIHTYDFCFQIDTDHSFIGCSPECLYQKEGNRIYSEALAGTNAAAVDLELNMQFQGELLDSQKEAEEHEYVFENVQAELKNICEEVVVVDRREILSLGYVQHLRSRFEGTLKTGIGDGDILGALHPTAAVNGYPKEAALAFIRQYERFSRGWYAGPVGWIGCDRSEFAVAIRSAYITGQQIKLFAGAGIVGASDPSREWAETEIKMTPFLNLFEASLKS